MQDTVTTRAESTQQTSAIGGRQDHVQDPLAGGMQDPLVQPKLGVGGVQSGAPEVSTSGGSPLPQETRGQMEQSLGSDFSDVRVHTDSSAPEQTGARALTSGSDVHFSPGSYDPGSQEGSSLLAHELTHVVQQRQGRVSSPQGKGGMVVDQGLEAEADRVGETVAQGGSVNLGGAGSGGGGVQPKLTVGSTALETGSTDPLVAEIQADFDDLAAKWGLDEQDLQKQLAEMLGAGDHQFASVAEAQAALTEAAVTKEHGQIDARTAFGTDGRSKAEVLTALRLGYRKLDTAESYGTINAVAAAVTESSVDRSDLTIVYKFDPDSGAEKSTIKSHVTGVAAKFGDSLDDVLIHNMSNDLGNAWPALTELKQAGKVKRIGVGNVGVEHADALAGLDGGVDVIENKVSDMLMSPALQKLLKDTGAEIYLYDFVKTAGDLGIKTEAGLKGLIMQAAADLPGADITPVMSSSSEVRMKTNQQVDRQAQVDQYLDTDALSAMDTITKARNNNTCTSTDAATPLSGTKGSDVQKILADGATWRSKWGSSGQGLAEFLVAETALESGDLGSARVPSRTGMKARYKGKPLLEVMEAFMGAKSCDHKWSVELLQVMTTSGAQWDSLLKVACGEIV